MSLLLLFGNLGNPPIIPDNAFGCWSVVSNTQTIWVCATITTCGAI